MHSGGLELAKLTYARLEVNLIRHRGDRTSVLRIKNLTEGCIINS